MSSRWDITMPSGTIIIPPSSEAPPPDNGDERERVAEWAGATLQKDPLALSLATTGLGSDAEVIALSVLRVTTGDPVYDALIAPLGQVEDDAAALHGYTTARLTTLEREGRTVPWAGVMRTLRYLTEGRLVLCYNRRFTYQMMDRMCQAHDLDITLEPEGGVFFSLQEAWSVWMSQTDERRGSRLKVQPLPLREEPPRTTLSDCAALALLLREMAGDLPLMARLGEMPPIPGASPGGATSR